MRPLADLVNDYWRAGLVKLTRKQAKAAGIPLPPKHRWSGQGKPKGPAKDDSVAQSLFLAACAAHGLPVPIAEYLFAHPRKWRFDWLFDGWLALEVQGGLFVEGRHSQGAALLKEHEKLNAAVCLGFSVVFCTPRDVESGAVFALLRKALQGREEQP